LASTDAKRPIVYEKNPTPTIIQTMVTMISATLKERGTWLFSVNVSVAHCGQSGEGVVNAGDVEGEGRLMF